MVTHCLVLDQKLLEIRGHGLIQLSLIVSRVGPDLFIETNMTFTDDSENGSHGPQ